MTTVVSEAAACEPGGIPAVIEGQGCDHTLARRIEGGGAPTPAACTGDESGLARSLLSMVDASAERRFQEPSR